MENLSLKLKLHLPNSSNPSCSLFTPKKHPLFIKPNMKQRPSKSCAMKLTKQTPVVEDAPMKLQVVENGNSRAMIMGAVSVGVLLLLSGMDEHKALALGPEGPLVEEFWDNVRRYGLYALTVSTGAIYTIMVPIFELLKNPITAILIVAIFGGGFYIVSQVVSAMVGISDFSYEYGN
ncbi:uncharacterized protein LOC127138295 [Lathyrus oleraceus]|uniref:Uncharacterized protein ycf33 n=1 Tax=Pisum sativum TaxID=3888 RepID=A0A9D4X645_PEA|nr:uncharacterized protein LOC127138295 [Pisum sativum]KAI5414453.1 hypothetical protein KIW84_040090 [Pisum sativum]